MNNRMIRFETIRCCLSPFLKSRKPSNNIQYLLPITYYLDSLILSNSSELLFLSSFNRRPISFSTQFESEISGDYGGGSESPFAEVVTDEDAVKEIGGEIVRGKCAGPKGRNEMEEGLTRTSCTKSFDSRNRDKRNLWALFSMGKRNLLVNKKGSIRAGNEDQTVGRRPLSFDIQMFTHHLYTEGYFEGASFIPGNKFDSTVFEISYARHFLKFVAVEFGKDHQEIAKWLNAVDLKKIALFGCPNLGYKNVYAAKNLRRFFEIEEHKVCENCRLKYKCKHANIGASKSANKLILADVMRILVVYGMGSVSVPNEIRDSVNRLLKEVVNLSQTVSRNLSRP